MNKTNKKPDDGAVGRVLKMNFASCQITPIAGSNRVKAITQCGDTSVFWRLPKMADLRQDRFWEIVEVSGVHDGVVWVTLNRVRTESFDATAVCVQDCGSYSFLVFYKPSDKWFQPEVSVSSGLEGNEVMSGDEIKDAVVIALMAGCDEDVAEAMYSVRSGPVAGEYSGPRRATA